MRADLPGRRDLRADQVVTPPVLRWVQAAAGNRAAIRYARGAVQRDEEPRVQEPGAEEPERSLSNPRFVGDRVLGRILSGDVDALSSAHNGRRGPVSKVQQALVDLGFELPMHLVDGSFGTETEEAIRQFRARHGLPVGSALDAVALEALDRAAPSPGERHEHTVDYDRLLADGRLDITVGVGYSDMNVHRRKGTRRFEETDRPVEDLEAERFRAWLTTKGFRQELLGWGPNSYWKAVRTLTWVDRDGAEQSREVAIWINLIVPGQGAAEEFREGLSSDEITIYSGHARYGSGPDFDAKATPDENFRIGIDRALRAAGRRTAVDEARRHGVGIDEENDLLEMVASGDFDPSRYRVLFMQACTSLAYLDEIREHVGGTENVDFIGTRRPSMFSVLEEEVGMAEIERFLEGILAAESVESIVAGMDDKQRAMHGRGHPFPAGGIFTTSGMGDNPRATASP